MREGNWDDEDGREKIWIKIYDNDDVGNMQSNDILSYNQISYVIYNMI